MLADWTHCCGHPCELTTGRNGLAALQLETKGKQIIACQNLVNAEQLVPGYKVEVRDSRRWLPAMIVVRVHSAQPRTTWSLPH